MSAPSGAAKSPDILQTSLRMDSCRAERCRFAAALSDFAALPVSIYNLFTDLTRFVDNYAAV